MAGSKPAFSAANDGRDCSIGTVANRGLAGRLTEADLIDVD